MRRLDVRSHDPVDRGSIDRGSVVLEAADCGRTWRNVAQRGAIWHERKDFEAAEIIAELIADPSAGVEPEEAC
ncbi:MAG: hypothetical protein AAF662_07180 [Pseudomonadota bacterium]